MNKKNALYLFVFMSLVVISGCGFKYNEGVNQTEKFSYLHFVGNTKDKVVTVDGMEGIELKDSKQTDDKKNFIMVDSGRHKVIVTLNGDVVVHRDIMIGKGMTKEIVVP